MNARVLLGAGVAIAALGIAVALIGITAAGVFVAGTRVILLGLLVCAAAGVFALIRPDDARDDA